MRGIVVVSVGLYSDHFDRNDWCHCYHYPTLHCGYLVVIVSGDWWCVGIGNDVGDDGGGCCCCYCHLVSCVG